MSKKSAVLKDGVLVIKDLFDITEMEIDTEEVNIEIHKLCDVSISIESDQVVVKVWKPGQTRAPAGKVEVSAMKLGLKTIEIEGADDGEE